MFINLKKCCVLFFLLGTTFAVNLDYLKCVYLSRVGPCVDSRYRTIDGTCNNLNDINFGKAYWPYGRFLPPTYPDGKHAFPVQTDNTPYVSARVVSNLIFPSGDPDSKQYTLALMNFGQLLAHEVGLAEGTQAGLGGNTSPVGCCKNGKFGISSEKDRCEADIVIPTNDPVFTPAGIECLDYGRTTTTAKYLCNLKDFDEAINLVSAYFDLSFLYGNLQYPAKNLRKYEDGLLKTVIKDGEEYPPIELITKSICPRAKPTEKICYKVGDQRGNQNPQLTTIQIMMVRAHNNLARKLKKINPGWNDETTFQETRIIMIALWQNNVYYEILPIFLGQATIDKYKLNNPNPGCLDDYDSSLDASTPIESASGALRYFHTLIHGDINTYNADRELVKTINISDWLDRGQVNELSKDVNYNTLARGLTIQYSAETDQFYDEEIKSRFDKDYITGLGFDLIAKDIQRSRGDGVARYLEVRRFCGLSVATTFEELVGDLSQQVVDKLQQIYPNVGSIDLISGGHNENHLIDSLVGPTYACILGKAYQLARQGDRYFFENCNKHRLTTEQLASVKSVPLAKLFCENTDITKIQAQVLKVVGPDNPLVDCDDIPGLDLTLWQNEPLEEEKPSGIVAALSEKYYDSYSYIQGLALKFYG